MRVQAPLPRPLARPRRTTANSTDSPHKALGSACQASPRPRPQAKQAAVALRRHWRAPLPWMRIGLTRSSLVRTKQVGTRRLLRLAPPLPRRVAHRLDLRVRISIRTLRPTAATLTPTTPPLVAGGRAKWNGSRKWIGLDGSDGWMDGLMHRSIDRSFAHTQTFTPTPTRKRTHRQTQVARYDAIRYDTTSDTCLCGPSCIPPSLCVGANSASRNFRISGNNKNLGVVLRGWFPCIFLLFGCLVSSISILISFPFPFPFSFSFSFPLPFLLSTLDRVRPDVGSVSLLPFTARPLSTPALSA